MAKRQDGGIRLRPVGTRKHRQNAPAYSPAGTGCPAFEQAVEHLYKGQNEESFLDADGRFELCTGTGDPCSGAAAHGTDGAQHACTVDGASGAHGKKAKDLQLWTLRNETGRTWLPMFTSAAAACADRSTSARPMADYTLQDAMELALSTPGGSTAWCWTRGATRLRWTARCSTVCCTRAIRRKTPVMRKQMPERKPPARATGRRLWNALKKAAELGSAMGLSLLADCIYKGRGTRTNRAKARRMWKEAADSGEILSNIALGDDCAARGDNGRALSGYRRAREAAAHMPDIEYTPQVCLRVAQTETRYTSRKKALALAAEARQGFAIKAREHEPDAAQWLAEADQLIRELTSELPAQPQPTTWNLYNWTKNRHIRTVR